MLNNSKVKRSSNRNFGLVFFVVFLIVSVWPLTYEGSIRIWSIIIALTFLFLGLMNSKILTPFNTFWFKFGMILGSVIAPIVMGIVFFAVVTPTGFIMKLLGKDVLNNKLNKSKKSYWIYKDKIKSSMKNQF